MVFVLDGIIEVMGSNEQPIYERDLSEIENALTFELSEIPEGFEDVKIYLLGEFNNFGRILEDGSNRRMTEEELQEFAFVKVESKYRPPKCISKIESGTSFKILVIPPEFVPDTNFEILSKHSIFDLYNRIDSRENEKYMGRLEEGVKALLRLEDATPNAYFSDEELVSRLRDLTLEDFRKYWNYGSHRWEFGKLSPVESETIVFAEGVLFMEMLKLLGKSEDEEYLKLKAVPKPSKDTQFLEVLSKAGIILGGTEEGTFEGPDGKNYPQNRYWMTIGKVETKVGGYGQQENVFP